MAKFGFFFSHCHFPGTQPANQASFSASRVRMPPLPLAAAVVGPPSASLPYPCAQLPADASRPDRALLQAGQTRRSLPSNRTSAKYFDIDTFRCCDLSSSGGSAERRALGGGPAECWASGGDPAERRASGGGSAERRASSGDPTKRRALSGGPTAGCPEEHRASGGVWQNVGYQVVVRQNVEPQVMIRQNVRPLVVVRQNVGPQNVEPQVVVQQNVGPWVVVRRHSGVRWWSSGGSAELRRWSRRSKEIFCQKFRRSFPTYFSPEVITVDFTKTDGLVGGFYTSKLPAFFTPVNCRRYIRRKICRYVTGGYSAGLTAASTSEQNSV
ncbi:hypothetical protein M5K25_009333 [Dendrobium thyrsiflorum]|uniref:Uncharacterized protein n=1 Tax=Dendrobium thyrsiflorum TaxID=117978 RepID=A0ABD0V6I2_DENTH